MNVKKLRRFLLIFFIVVYVGIFVFEGIFNFNQSVISRLFVKYDDFAGTIYVLLLTVGVATGLLTAIIVLSGFFLFNITHLLLLTSLGVILGISLTFTLARLFGHKAFMEYIKVSGKKEEKVKEILRNDSIAIVVLFNFVFFLPSTFGGIVGGLTDAKLSRLIPISIVGNLINQLFFILFLYGAQFGVKIVIIVSIGVLFLNSTIPIYTYRKNIKDIFVTTFRKEKEEISTDK